MRNPFESRNTKEVRFRAEMEELIGKDDPMEVAGRIIDDYGGTRSDNPKLKHGFELFLEALRNYAAKNVNAEEQLPETLLAATEKQTDTAADRFIHRWKEVIRMQFPVAEAMFDEAFAKVFPENSAHE